MCRSTSGSWGLQHGTQVSLCSCNDVGKGVVFGGFLWVLGGGVLGSDLFVGIYKPNSLLTC
jgi:hypothetical protein